jgi:hypothetical protein
MISTEVSSLATHNMAQASKQNDHQLYVVSKIIGARCNDQDMLRELLFAWRGFPVGEATWEPYSVMAVDVPEMVTKFMESLDDSDMVSEMRFLESSHRQVLCVAKDENFVDIICRGCSSNFLRKSRI